MNFDDIYREYYQKIFNYCYAKLNDYKIAEDCTQDIFLALSKKMGKLKLNTNISAWLYKAAKLQVKYYYRKNKGDISLDSMENSENISADESHNEGIFDEILSAEEYKMLNDYYIAGEDIDKMTAEMNISKASLYQRIRRAKQKIIKNSDKLHNLLKK